MNTTRNDLKEMMDSAVFLMAKVLSVASDIILKESR